MGSRGVILTLVPYLLQERGHRCWHVCKDRSMYLVYEAPVLSPWVLGDSQGGFVPVLSTADRPHHSPWAALYQNSISAHPKALVTEDQVTESE